MPMLKTAAIVALTLAPLAARAQVTPDRAIALQQQIQDWLRNTLGDAAATARGPVRITAAGDHFDVAAPLGAAPDAPVMTGKMTDAGSGRWAVDDLAIPSPSVFHTQLPPAKTPGAPTGEVTTTLTVGEQRQRILFDSTLTTPSTWTSAMKDVGISTTGTSLVQLSHIDSGTGATTMTPAADGRVDLKFDSALDGYTMKMAAENNPQAVAVAFGKASVLVNLSGVSRDRGLEALHLLSRAAPADAGARRGTLDRETSRALLTVMADLAKGVSIDETINDLAVTTKDMTGTLKALSIGLTSNIDGGKLQAQAPLAAEGLALPDLGLGSMAALIPTKLMLTPAVSGVPTGALMQVSRRLVDKQDPTDADIAALFGQGPITAGIANFLLDVSGSSFSGAITTLIASPSQFSGSGRITADNIDKLQQAMASDPQTAQFAPIIIFLKGIGRSEQSRIVWDLVYADGRLLVNGQDMAALTGGPPASPTPPPNRQAPRPAPKRQP